MKKLWLQMLVVFGLGVATVPGTVQVERWLRNSGSPPSQKFADVKLADFSPHEDGDFEKSVRVENSKPEPLDEEPAVLAQNSPNRNPVQKRYFDAPPGAGLVEVESDQFDSVPFKQRTDSTNSKAEPPDGIESLAEAELSDEQKAKLTTLREKLAELTKAKAELVNEQTLEETIFSLEKQISNLHAAQKLLSAQKILRALAEEFPDSPAAAKAQRMLEAAESKKSPRPSPDPLNTEPFGG